MHAPDKLRLVQPFVLPPLIQLYHQPASKSDNNLEWNGSRGEKPMAEENLEGGGDGFPNTSRVLVEHGHSLIISREGLILTLSILPCPQGRIC